MLGDGCEALDGAQAHLLNLIVEHVHEEVQGEEGEAVVLHGEAGQRVHGRHAHREALVFQPVHKGAATPCARK